MKLEIVDWSDDAFAKAGEPIVTERIEIPEFKGFFFDGGRLDITGHPDTIYISTHQFYVNVVDFFYKEKQ